SIDPAILQAVLFSRREYLLVHSKLCRRRGLLLLPQFGRFHSRAPYCSSPPFRHSWLFLRRSHRCPLLRVPDRKDLWQLWHRMCDESLACQRGFALASREILLRHSVQE